MTLYDNSADLLELLNDLTGRAVTDSIDAVKKYKWLTRAELEVISEMASIAPQVFYPKTDQLPAMVTTNNKEFTFGLDADNNPLVPFGNVQIYRRQQDIPYRPLIPGVDYLDEVSQIRLPRGRSYGGTLFYRGIITPPAITATEPPHLQPLAANELTAIRAAKNFAEGGGLRNPALADRMDARWAKRFPFWCLVWKRQFSAGGAVRWLALTDIVTPL